MPGPADQEERLKPYRAIAGVLLGLGMTAALAAAPPGLTECRLRGVEHTAWCGQVKRPLNPEQPAGPAIDVHFAVLPALARNRKPDPVFFIAGGPGQSAIDVAAQAQALLGRFSNRRDIVLVDQRGTGRSAPLACDDADDPRRPLAESTDPSRREALLAACRARLQQLPHGDLRQYTTTIAMHDLDAVRRALGAERINLVGVSYGTRAALEYLRLYPQAVRRAVLDGVAPPDMVLPASFSTDGQAALDALFAACEAEPACRTRHPALRTQWQQLLVQLPREVTVAHPFTGAAERLTLTRDLLLGLVRAPLYVPSLSAALPEAIAQAAGGRFEGLAGLATSLGGGRQGRMAEGMHFSVVCTEDLPRLPAATDAPGRDFGDALAATYRRVCDGWPRGTVAPAFYTLTPSPAPVLLLSGGLDPATPPRHGERVAKALGPLARHAVVPNAGHGVMGVGCMRDVVFRFVDVDDAAAVDLACAAGVPRPPAFRPLEAAR